jgi:nicotinate phosphoribosyltransferase
VAGTHAHSWVMAHPTELEAFQAYARIYPDSCLLLVDTYDTLNSGVPNAISVFKDLQKKRPSVRAAIRLDSGDLARLSKDAYKQLTAAGFNDPLIVGSNDLDEDLIADLKRQGARINSWGVGTHLITSRDYPALGGVYKVVAVEEGGVWRPKLKVAGNPEKTTDPDRKQVVRLYGPADAPLADVLFPADSGDLAAGQVVGVDRERFHEKRSFTAPRAEPLLQQVMAGGVRTGKAPALEDVRARAQAQIAALPDEMKRLRNPDIYPVLLSPELAKTKQSLLDRRTRA